MQEPYWTRDFDPYAILGVDRSATGDQIRRAYHQKSRLHHPDAGGDAELQIRLNLAYRLLSDPAQRAEYDRARPGPGPAAPTAPPAATPDWTYGTGLRGSPPPGTQQQARRSQPDPPAEPEWRHHTGHRDRQPGETEGAPDGRGSRDPGQSTPDGAWAAVCLLAGIAGIVWIAVATGWRFGLFALVVVAVFTAAGVLGVLTDDRGPAGVGAAGMALVAGLLAAPMVATPTVLTGDHTGIAAGNLAAAAASSISCAVALKALAESAPRPTAAQWGAVAVVAALFTVSQVAVAWTGERSGWHAGVAFAGWTGAITIIVCYGIRLAGRRPRAGSLVRAVLAVGILPVVLLLAGITVSAKILSAGWPPEQYLLVWLAVSFAALVHTVHRYGR